MYIAFLHTNDVGAPEDKKMNTHVVRFFFFSQMDSYDKAGDQSLTAGEGDQAHTENSVRVVFILGYMGCYSLGYNTHEALYKRENVFI